MKKEVNISDESCQFFKVLEFVIRPKITNTTPAKHINKNLGQTTGKIKFADSAFHKPDKVDALIGAEVFLN